MNPVSVNPRGNLCIHQDVNVRSSTGGPLRVVVLISGTGTTLENLLRSVKTNRLRGVKVVGVIASRECDGLKFARMKNIPYVVVTRGKPFNEVAFSNKITGHLHRWKADLVVMGGFLSKYIVPTEFQGKVINIHPSLLPEFGGKGMYGTRVHEAVIQSGIRESGCTVHYVNNEYDAGRIIASIPVVVQPNWGVTELAAHIKKAEQDLYPRVIQLFADKKAQARNSRACVRGTSTERRTKLLQSMVA